MDPTAPNPTPPDSRRLSIRLPRPLWLGLAAALLVVGAIGAHVGIWIYRHNRQDDAIREIKILSGEIGSRRTGPAWLSSLIGEQRMKVFDEVEAVTFLPEMAIFDRGTTGTFGMFSKLRTDRPTINDEKLACLTKLAYLKQLNLRWTNVGDAGMEHVCNLHALEELVLIGADVSDASVLRLTQLRNLKTLDVGLTLMTSDGVAKLRALLPSCTIKYHRRPTYSEFFKAINAKPGKTSD